MGAVGEGERTTTIYEVVVDTMPEVEEAVVTVVVATEVVVGVADDRQLLRDELLLPVIDRRSAVGANSIRRSASVHITLLYSPFNIMFKRKVERTSFLNAAFLKLIVNSTMAPCPFGKENFHIQTTTAIERVLPVLRSKNEFSASSSLAAFKMSERM